MWFKIIAPRTFDVNRTLATDLRMAASRQPLILAIETATRAGSVAVARGTELLASRTGEAASSHSTDLLENIDGVLKDARVELHDIDCFAVAIGPGSFTGLRIGLATAKSLAVATHRKCAAISTLAAVAFQAGPSDRTVALLPAGRGEVFAQMFSVDDQDARAFDEARHLSPARLVESYGKHARVLWAGEGARAQLEMLKREAASRKMELANALPASNGSYPVWAVSPEVSGVSDAVARLAFGQWRSDALIAPENLRANYVRLSDAEINSKS